MILTWINFNSQILRFLCQPDHNITKPDHIISRIVKGQPLEDRNIYSLLFSQNREDVIGDRGGNRGPLPFPPVREKFVDGSRIKASPGQSVAPNDG